MAVRRHEIEAFGIAFVDLMCLAFVGQIILWLNQPRPADSEKRLNSLVITVEQYGNSHFRSDKSFIVQLANTSDFTDLSPEITAGDGIASLIAKISDSFPQTNTFKDECTLVENYSAGQDNGPAGAFSFCFDGISDQQFEIWVPLFQDRCFDDRAIHSVQVRSMSLNGDVWAAAFSHNSRIDDVSDDNGEWTRLEQFLACDPHNCGKTWEQLFGDRFFVVKGTGDKNSTKTLWLHLGVSREGVTAFNLKESPDSGKPVEASWLTLNDLKRLAKDLAGRVIPL